MQRFSSALIGAAAGLAVLASSAPAQAASPQARRAVEQSSAAIVYIGDRDWKHRGHWRDRGHRDRGHWRHRGKRHDRDHFSFGFGFPFASVPYAYRTYRCPYGYSYDQYRHVCVGSRHHYRHRPGFSIEFGF